MIDIVLAFQASSIFYWFYMLFANIFLLNVLIAVMSRTMQLESKEANLVARYRQTNLVLDEEIEQEAATRSSREGGLSRRLYARWLHVLLPAEYNQEGEGTAGGGATSEFGGHSSGHGGWGGHGGGAEPPVQQQLRALQRDMRSLLAAVQQMPQTGGGSGGGSGNASARVPSLPRAGRLTPARADSQEL